MTDLKDGRWALIYNDLERDQYSLRCRSPTMRRTWRWTKHLERDAGRSDRSATGSLPVDHPVARRPVACDLQLLRAPGLVTPDASGLLPLKSIKHAHVNGAWLMQPESGVRASPWRWPPSSAEGEVLDQQQIGAPGVGLVEKHITLIG